MTVHDRPEYALRDNLAALAALQYDHARIVDGRVTDIQHDHHRFAVGGLHHDVVPLHAGQPSAVLLSGGIDSIALTYWKRPQLGITIDYGQVPAAAEIQAAQAVCDYLNLAHEIIRIDCRSIGSGDLAGLPATSAAPASDWWPFRNQLLITMGAARALTKGVKTILIGTVASDHYHADGTPEFANSISHLMKSQEGGMEVEAPAVGLSSAGLVRKSEVPVELLAWAHSCHVANFACGRCRGCIKHFETTQELGFGPY